MQEERRFTAITFSDKEFEFIVAGDGNIYSDLFFKPASYIMLKPNLYAKYQDGGNFSFDDRTRRTGEERELIREYRIDEDLLEDLVENKKAFISTEMALFYGYDPDYGYDRKHKMNPFKHIKKEPEKIFYRQKQGLFH